MKHIANIMRHQYGSDEMTVGRIFESGRGRNKKYTARLIGGEVIAEAANKFEVFGQAMNAHPMNFNRAI